MVIEIEVDVMAKFLLFCILLVLCWPLALLAVIAYPFVWLLHDSVSDCGDRGGRGAGTGERHYFSAGADGAGDLRATTALMTTPTHRLKPR